MFIHSNVGNQTRLSNGSLTVTKSTDEKKLGHYPLEVRYKKGKSLGSHELFEEGNPIPYTSNGYLSVVLTVTELTRHTATYGWKHLSTEENSVFVSCTFRQGQQLSFSI